MDEVELVGYDPGWPGMFAAEAVRLSHALPPGLVLRIEHFGSTAIPGMIAKPIIDILLGVASLDEARRVAVSALQAMGYAFWADNPRPDRLFFVKGLPPASPRRTHHVHIASLDNEMFARLSFRDMLRADAAERAAYQGLKQQLAVRYREDREAYTAAKADYVKAALERASRRGFRA